MVTELSNEMERLWDMGFMHLVTNVLDQESLRNCDLSDVNPGVRADRPYARCQLSVAGPCTCLNVDRHND